MEQVYKAPEHQAFEKKPLASFTPLKDLKEGDKIEGIHKGLIESKTTPGSFFNVFEKDDNGYGYGNSAILTDKITKAKEKAKELGIETPYISITYKGKKKGTKGAPYYNFSDADIYRPDPKKPAADAITTDSIPF